MKIADLFRYAGRKHLEGEITTTIEVVAGTKICLRPKADGYEMHLITTDETATEKPAGGSDD